MFAFFIHALADFNLHIPALTATCAILSPLIFGYSPNDNSEANGVKKLDNSSTAKIPLLFLAVLCLAGASQLPGRYTYQRLLRTTSQPQPDIEKAQELSLKASRQLPYSPYPAIVLARAAEKAGAYTVAEEALAEAVARTPHRGALWQKLASLRRSLDMYDKAESAAEQAAKWLPEHKR